MVRAPFVLTLLILTAFAHALDARAEGATLFVNEIRIHTFGTSFSGMTADQRAVAAAQVAKSSDGNDLPTKKKVGTQWIVSLGQRPFVTITEAEAKSRNSTSSTLAATITQRLIDAVKLPALVSDTTSLEVPVHKTMVIKISGWAARKATVEASQKEVVSVKRKGGELTVSALKPGSVDLRVFFNDESVVVSLSVLPYAFNVKKTLTAQVIGSPANSTVVAGAVSAAIQTRSDTPVQNRVWVRVIDPQAIKVGQSAIVKARVKATGVGFYPYEGEVSVKVVNIDADMPREDELWYSNEPEQVLKPCRLYWGELLTGKTTRLLYHHQSAFSMPQVIRYMVANPTDKPADVAISLGDSKPDKNPTRAGYVAGDQFFMKWLSRSAEVVHLPARSVVPITLRRLGPGETCSGVATLSLRSGGAERILVVGDSVMQQTLYDEWQVGQGVVGAWHSVVPKALDSVRISLEGVSVGTFPEPYKEVRMDYEVGGRFGFTRIGETPIKNQDSNTALQGRSGLQAHRPGT